METRTISMIIHKYIPNKLYGFAIDSSDFQVFFHLGQFKPITEPNVIPAPPILGEPVLVTFIEPLDPSKAPKATNVERLQKPKQLMGIVESYDSSRGYGFVLGEDGISYHLHNSEILNNKYPLSGDTVRFFTGLRLNKPRACHIEVIR